MKRILALALLCLLFSVRCAGQEKPIYSSPEFAVYSDRVVQGKYEAKVISSTEMSSGYESPANQYLSPVIDFKFSINGKDNEMMSGSDHHFACVNTGGPCETPLIRFGTQLKSAGAPAGTYLKQDTRLHIRLDMRHVFRAFDSAGYFVTFNKSKLYKTDFKGVYVAGGTPPLSWDFDNLHNFKHLEMADPDGDHIYELTLLLNSPSSKRGHRAGWKLALDTRPYPQYNSPFPIANALYNLALEEMIRAVEPDSTLRTGKEWSGVWTRDVSYSILLSMATLQPRAAQNSLMRKVKDGVIVQDTGTGGAYPVSTDRMVWALAAWEIYKVTGDHAWLKSAFAVIKKSIEADLVNAYDETTGLVKGESSFLDWREQTYPEWMEPADIYESLCLGTNAVHHQANTILASMARLLKDEQTERRHRALAARIRTGINEHLWMKDKGYYGQFLYGRNAKILSPRSEALGEALTVLFDIAGPEKTQTIVSSTPLNAFGIPCIYPQIPHIPPYHNDGVWPFVQSYWALGSAKAGNATSVMHSLASIWRPAALFLTNKENFVASSGDYASTQINSDNMLWSLSGNIAMIHKIIFGISYGEDGIALSPFIPEPLQGVHELKNFKYRKATLDIVVKGFGNKIAAITMDGKRMKDGWVPSALSGKHRIEITMANNKVNGEINLIRHSVSPVAPTLAFDGTTLHWSRVPGAEKYKLLLDGKPYQTTSDTALAVMPGAGQLQVIAIGEEGIESFASEPYEIVFPGRSVTTEAEDGEHESEKTHTGFSGSGYVRTTSGTAPLLFAVNVPADGLYAIDFRYANGHGPVNTENKCAIRRIALGGKFIGIIVLPQRGKGEWSDWGYTNRVLVNLRKGMHQLFMVYDPLNRNMNGDVNEALVDLIRLVRVN